MFKSLISITLCATLLFSFGQDKPKQEDDDFLNPAPNVGKNDNRETSTPKPEGGQTYAGGRVRELIPISLQNYGIGKFQHENIFRFCKMIIDQIENTERKENQIISISIKGFADGLVNKGVRVSRDQVHRECAKFAPFDRGIDDIELATLRACQVEGILKDLLKGKSYFVFVNLTMARPHDEPDGEGDTGGSLRKVIVQISYLERE
jgi:hypothetical protein